MGEQNCRAVELEPPPGEGPKDRRARRAPMEGPPADADRALSVTADERQTGRQAPAAASPGESHEDDSIG